VKEEESEEQPSEGETTEEDYSFGMIEDNESPTDNEEEDIDPGERFWENIEGEDEEADVDSDDAFTPDTNVISDGVFWESMYRSAPYFDIIIDGITVIG
jgi:hypothetical protein